MDGSQFRAPPGRASTNPVPTAIAERFLRNEGPVVEDELTELIFAPPREQAPRRSDNPYAGYRFDNLEDAAAPYAQIAN